MQLSAVCPVGFPDFPEAPILKFLFDQGIRQVHVVRDFNVKRSAREVLSLLSEFGLAVESFHAEHGQHMDLASSSSEMRRRTVEKLTEEAQFALEIGVKTMIAHPSGTMAPQDPQGSGNFRRSAEMLARSAERLEITILIENMPPEFAYGLEAGKLAGDVRYVDSKWLGLCFDTGHANMSHLSVARQITDTQGYMHYVHASDNNGSADQHLLPFFGAIDWSEVGQALRDIGYDRIFCLEVFEPIDALKAKISPHWWEKFRSSLDCRPKLGLH
jgi:sugar phosphate isomerase/epimerase